MPSRGTARSETPRANGRLAVASVRWYRAAMPDPLDPTAAFTSAISGVFVSFGGFLAASHPEPEPEL